MRYASETSVPSERSKAEIESTLIRYGADEFQSGWREGEAIIEFRLRDSGLRVRFHLPLPRQDDAEFAMTPGGRRQRSDDARGRAWEQATRQRWRALALVIKAKLEAVASGITTVEEEFLAHVVHRSGRTIGEMVLPDLPALMSGGSSLPKLLSLPSPKRDTA